jgi:hypothetical protein
MSALSFKLHYAIPLMAMASILFGCTTAKSSSAFAIPTVDYIGAACEPTEMSRIIKSQEVYALCLDHQWVMVSAEQFTTNRVLLGKPIRKPNFVMSKPATVLDGGIENACITVIEYEVGWVDIDYEGSMMRMPLVDGSCSITPCNNNPMDYMESVCQ